VADQKPASGLQDLPSHPSDQGAKFPTRPHQQPLRRRRRKSNEGLGWLAVRGPGRRPVRPALRPGSSPARGR
jgi:hypothetical protein